MSVCLRLRHCLGVAGSRNMNSKNVLCILRLCSIYKEKEISSPEVDVEADLCA